MSGKIVMGGSEWGGIGGRVRECKSVCVIECVRGRERVCVCGCERESVCGRERESVCVCV